jgi:hypothetical protein
VPWSAEPRPASGSCGGWRRCRAAAYSRGYAARPGRIASVAKAGSDRDGAWPTALAMLRTLQCVASLGRVSSVLAIAGEAVAQHTGGVGADTELGRDLPCWSAHSPRPARLCCPRALVLEHSPERRVGPEAAASRGIWPFCQPRHPSPKVNGTPPRDRAILIGLG